MTAEERFERNMKLDMETVDLIEEAQKEDEDNAELFLIYTTLLKLISPS